MKTPDPPNQWIYLPNSTKSMEYLKGYSAKASFVLTRGVRWKLPTFATDYTDLPIRFCFPRTLTCATRRLHPHASRRHPLTK
jgi:hypothetical protein